MGWFKELQIPQEITQILKEEFDIELQTDKVKIKRLNWGEYTDLQKASITVKGQVGSSMNATVDASEFQNVLFLKGVVEAPWKVSDLGEIRKLPPVLIEWVKKELEEFNKLEKKKSE